MTCLRLADRMVAGDKSWIEQVLGADGTDGIASAAIRLLSTRVG